MRYKRLMVKRGVVVLDVETGTELGDVGEIAMAYNLGIGVSFLQILEQEPQ